MSQWRQLVRLIAMPAVLAFCAFLPSAAAAAVPLPVAAAEPVAVVETTVADAAQPPSGGMTQPAGDTGGQPVEDTIAPIAHAATVSVPSTPVVAAPQKTLDDHARPRISHIAATSSGERTSRRRAAHDRGLDGAPRRPSSERPAPAHRAPAAAAALADSRDASPAAAEVAVTNSAPAASAPGAAAAGGSGGLSSGGGFALLVASLLLAGPRLRRQLAELPAVCRPAAFLAVLERPG